VFPVMPARFPALEKSVQGGDAMRPSIFPKVLGLSVVMSARITVPPALRALMMASLLLSMPMGLYPRLRAAWSHPPHPQNRSIIFIGLSFGGDVWFV